MPPVSLFSVAASSPPDSAFPVPPGFTPRFESAYYFQPVAWFFATYGRLPVRRVFELPDAKTLHGLRQTLAEWFPDLTARTIVETNYYDHEHPAGFTHWGAFQLAPGLVLYYGTRSDYGSDDVQLLLDPTQTEAHATELARLTEHLTALLESPRSQERQQIWVMQASDGDTRFRPLDIKIPELDLATHYNDDLAPVHARIVQRLLTPNDKGIVILHGPPGTGKTSYIRHLCSLTEKRKLFVPPNLATHIADPAFINQLYNNTDSILLIEDAEQVLLRRDNGNALAGAVSNLLNISDGLLSDCFHIQVICTFNTDLAHVDQALLRKGRLIAAYEFGPLAQAKAAALAASLGQTQPITGPTTLAEIFGRDTDDPDAPDTLGGAMKRTIGFGRG